MKQLSLTRIGPTIAFLLALLATGVPSTTLHSDEPPARREGMPREEEADAEAALGVDELMVPRWRMADGPQVRAAFRDVVVKAGESTVCIHCEGKHAALGGIVGADGWILTKATPLCGKLNCILPDGRSLPATTVAESREHDLALLKIEAKGLTAIDLKDAPVPEVGSWLATVGRSRDPVAVGVVSVASRAIPAQAGILGVQLEESEPVVVHVFPESAALKAGIEEGDRIRSVGGKRTASRAELKELIASYNPGDEIELSVERDGKELELTATLDGLFPGFPIGRSEFQNGLGSKLSVRRFGFPMAFQHDTVLRPTDCGGPVVDVDGRVIGFNIARAGRTESYALPLGDVEQVVKDLMAKGLRATAKAPVAP